MSGGEEQPECPLCMEPFDIDDVSFYPCTCGYQICRFCWHRIRTNENGLCPACRKAYPEDPAEFKPLTDDEVHRIKKDRRQKESQRKQKSAESRKHLANVRVVQKNLVFVVGLSPRLCDAEILRRHEYFGKFGKIHKVVINQSTSYVGSQGPSASAYVTYLRPEDALVAIRTVNNLQVDGRTLKASLGTTKYCSHFLKGTQCMKQDCMYLHDYGDEAASFTKEEIQQGKHLVYEQKLHEQFGGALSTMSSSPDQTVKVQTSGKQKEVSPASSGQLSPVGQTTSISPTNQIDSVTSVASSLEENLSSVEQHVQETNRRDGSLTTSGPPPLSQRPLPFVTQPVGDHLSLFSDSGFPSLSRHLKPPVPTVSPPEEPREVTKIPDTISVGDSGTQDWQGSGFPATDSSSQDDDCDWGFDPWDVSARALADLIEKEKVNSFPRPQHVPPSMTGMAPPTQMHGFHSRLKLLPPGFTPNGYPPNPANMRPPLFPHMAAMQHQQQQRSRMLGLMRGSVGGPPQLPPPPPLGPRMHFQSSPGSAHNLFSGPSEPTTHATDSFYSRPTQPQDAFMWRDWQEGLKALLPNVNISFGNPPHNSFGGNGGTHGLAHSNGFIPSQVNQRPNLNQAPSAADKAWCSRSVPDLSWDPAIINSGDVAVTDGLGDDAPPHWMASLHHLTEENSMQNHHTLGNTYGQSPNNSSASWMSQQLPSTRIHPPGFGLTSPVRPGHTGAESQLFGEHQLSAS